MLKHLLVMTVSAPLILLGEPSWPLLCGLPKWWVGRNLLLPRRTPMLLGRFFDSTIFAWLAGTVTVVVWHVPALFQLGLSSPAWHALQDLSFLCAGFLFWRPVVRHWTHDAEQPQWSMPVYLFLATLPCDILSAFLTFCGRVVYPSYLSAAQFASVSPLADQEFAGAMMWVWVTFAYLLPAIVITMRILAPGPVGRELEPGTLSRPMANDLSSSATEVV
jgi:cytochrome c oxidase assembly factor CtaG